jgi:chromosome segregation ATPase
MTITTLIILAVAAVAAGAIFSPKFRQLLRIRGGKAVDAGSTALEKEKDQYNQLVAKLPKQRDSVAKTKANATLAQKRLNELETKLGEIEGEFKLAESQKAADDVTNAIADDYAATEAAIATQKAVATEAASIADEALKALEETTKALAKFKSRIEADGNKVELTQALETAATARQELADIKTQISGAGQASAEIDRALEEARAKNDMSKGSTTDQAREKLKEQAAAASAKDRLRAKIGGADAVAPSTPTN